MGNIENDPSRLFIQVSSIFFHLYVFLHIFSFNTFHLNILSIWGFVVCSKTLYHFLHTLSCKVTLSSLLTMVVYCQWIDIHCQDGSRPFAFQWLPFPFQVFIEKKANMYVCLLKLGGSRLGYCKEPTNMCNHIGQFQVDFCNNQPLSIPSRY
jgi:hypothetical protein